MGMSFDLSPRMEMRQEMTQRMALEQLLEQKLEQQLLIKMTLEQHLEKEKLVEGFIRWANEHDSWVDYDKDGFRFRYARLPYKIAKPIADKAGPGFVHCHYNPFEGRASGEWTIFVVPNLIPEKFEDFVAIHERGEEISLANHYFASQLEFALSSSRRKTMDYTGFIDAHYPGKFVDLTQEVHFPILPEELVDFLNEQGKRNEKELEIAERLIEKFPLPTAVLRLMKRYETATEQIEKRLYRELGILQNTLWGLVEQAQTIGAYTSPEKAAYVLDRKFRKTLLGITEEDIRGVSPGRVNGAMRILGEQIKDYFRKVISVGSVPKNISIPYNFFEAREAAQQNKRVIATISRVEDRTRDRKNPEEISMYASPEPAYV